MRFIKPDDTVDHIMSKWNAVKYVFCFGTFMAPENINVLYMSSCMMSGGNHLRMDCMSSDVILNALNEIAGEPV